MITVFTSLDCKFPCVAAMNCGNLKNVAENIKKVWLSKKIIIIADNDKRKELKDGINSGIVAAQEVVDKKLAVGFVAPELVNNKEFERISDWNDYFVIHGEADTKQVIQEKVDLLCMSKEEREEKQKRHKIRKLITLLDPSIQIEPQEFIGGMYPRKFVSAIVAPSGTGKTMLLSMCIDRASKDGYRVGVVSPELSKERLGYRIDSSRTHMSNMAMQKGLLLPNYEIYFNEIMDSDEHIFVADTSDFADGVVTVQQCRSFVKSKKLDILFIDGIVYVRPDGWNPRMLTSESMGLAGRQLFQLSKDLSIPVVGVVQARRRSGEKRSENEEISDSESLFGSYELAQATTRMVSINRLASALKLVNVKNRYGKEGESWVYNYDFDKMLLTYIPDLEDIKNKEENQEEVKDKFKHVF